MILSLTSCNNEIDEEKLNCAIDRNNELCLDPETWEWDYNKANFDGKGMEVTIVVPSIIDYDPNDRFYAGSQKTEKQELQGIVEKEYNISIKYVAYAQDWGKARVKWIKEGLENKEDIGDIFLIDSSWIKGLAENQLITDLTNIFQDYKYTQDEYYNELSRVDNKIYGYKTGYFYPDYWLYYNQNLIEEYNLPDPATLWNKGEWTWSNFLDLVEQAQSQFDQEGRGIKWALDAEPYILSKGLLSASGMKLSSDDKVLIAGEEQQKMYKKFQEMENLYWITGGSVLGWPFRDGFALFSTGELSYCNNPLIWPETLHFEISAVPYPRSDEDQNLDEYQIPITTGDMYTIRNVKQGENGITSEILFNILDDLNNGLKPTEKTEKLTKAKYYEKYIEERITSSESKKALINLVNSDKDYTYLEMMDVLSLTLGNGTHYSTNGIYPEISKLIINNNQDLDVEEELKRLQEIYQKVLDELYNYD